MGKKSWKRWKKLAGTPKWLNLQWGIVASVRKRMISWNNAKRSWASDGSPPAPAQILGHWPWRLPFSWRVIWKSDCCQFQEARRTQGFLRSLSLHGRRAGERRAAFLCTFLRWDWGVLKMAPMANGSHVSFNWNSSLRKLECWGPSVLSVSV